jgi:hypothetical protein
VHEHNVLFAAFRPIHLQKCPPVSDEQFHKQHILCFFAYAEASKQGCTARDRHSIRGGIVMQYKGFTSQNVLKYRVPSVAKRRSQGDETDSKSKLIKIINNSCKLRSYLIEILRILNAIRTPMIFQFFKYIVESVMCLCAVLFKAVLNSVSTIYTSTLLCGIGWEIIEISCGFCDKASLLRRRIRYKVRANQDDQYFV